TPGDDLLRRARAYVAKAANASEGGRNDAAFGLAGNLRAFVGGQGERLEEHHVQTLMREWNTRNTPPLAEAELLRCTSNSAVNGTPRPDKPPKQSPGRKRRFALSDIGNCERGDH